MGHGSMGHGSLVQWVTWVMGHKKWPIVSSARAGRNSCATSATNSSDTAPPCRSIWKYTTVWSRAPAVRVITEVHRNGTWIVVCKVDTCVRNHTVVMSVTPTCLCREMISLDRVSPNLKSNRIACHTYYTCMVSLRSVAQRHHSRHY